MQGLQNNREGNNFDFIRFVAASFVIITHSHVFLMLGEFDALSRISRNTLQFSHLGVAIFFTISGYLITQSLVSSSKIISYLWRRCVRIFPGLIVMALLVAFVLGPIVTTLPVADYFKNPGTYKFLCSISLYKLVLYLPGVFTTNQYTASVNGSLWTLAYEFTFYLLLIPLFLAGILRQRYLLLVFWLLLFALRAYLGPKYFYYSYATPYLAYLNITYFIELTFYFSAGALYFLFRDKVPYKLPYFLLALGLLAGGIALHENIGRLMAYICIPYMVFYLAFLRSPLNHFGKYGDFSYGMYIYAYPIQQTILYFTHGNISLPVMVLLSFFFTLPFAVLSWHVIEKNALKLKNLFK